jgi:hypothetical protein
MNRQPRPTIFEPCPQGDSIEPIAIDFAGVDSGDLAQLGEKSDAHDRILNQTRMPFNQSALRGPWHADNLGPWKTASR